MLFKYNNSLNKQTPFDWPLGHITNNLPLALKPIAMVSHTHLLKMTI